MKKKYSLPKQNLPSKKNKDHPFSNKERINSSSNYLYIQLKNKYNNSPNIPKTNEENDNKKKFNLKIKNVNSIKTKENKVKNIRVTNNKMSKSQKSSIIKQKLATEPKNNKTKTLNSKATPTNIREGSFFKNKKRASPSHIEAVNENKIKKYFLNQDNQKLLNVSFGLNNKNERIKTPIVNKKEKINDIMKKINPTDNSMILSSSSLYNGTFGQLNKSNDILSRRRLKHKNRTNSEQNLFHKKNSFYNNNKSNNLFRPKNIFSQFKKKKAKEHVLSINNIFINNKNINELSLLDNFFDNNKNSTKNINKQEKSNPINNINKSKTQNSIKTNDTSAIQLNQISNLMSHGTASNNNISNINYECHYNQSHEININLLGIVKKEKLLSQPTNINTNINIGISQNNFINNEKPKIWKGKKIKCMHDLSKTGVSGDEKKVNQDNYFIFKNFVQGFDYIYMGVCDGHGYYGHEVSGFIKENLPMDLNHVLKKKKLNLLTDDLSEAIKTCFINENKNLLNNRQIDSDLSGTTCVSVIYTPQKLIIANIGDSRCILGKYQNNKWISQNLSRDHKPTLIEEAQRIKKVGGRIHQMRDEDGEFVGPMRVYMRNKEMPGLAMTRSFGDYYGSLAGTISEPEVTEHIFAEEDKFMVIASDGLFEFIESEKVVDYVKDFYNKNDIVGCCEFLYKESCNAWLNEEEDTIDDITIILVFFDELYE